MQRIITILLVANSLAGCSAFSATALRCGTDGQSSFVDLINLPSDISKASRDFAELCSFAFEQMEPS